MHKCVNMYFHIQTLIHFNDRYIHEKNLWNENYIFNSVTLQSHTFFNRRSRQH